MDPAYRRFNRIRLVGRIARLKRRLVPFPIRLGPPTCAALYARASVLQCDSYQILIDLGWRRSGTLLYRPEMRHSCCPHYTIRLPVSEFRARRDQRSACNRWNKFVLGDDYVKKAAILRPKSRAEKATSRNGFDLVKTIHEAEFDRLPAEPKPAHKFVVTLEPASFTQEKHLLFSNYQQAVHKEPPEKCQPDDFERFLCKSPLVNTERQVNGKSQPLGSFHQCYWLDGRLIAFGVLDLLPHCVSGVYFVYHQDYEKYSFGKLSALREACLALEGEYQYYYMGYYIHSCSKMKYKNDYQPQYFLDLETKQWDPLDQEALSLLDTHHYLSLSQLRQQNANGTLDGSNPAESTKDEIGADAVAKMLRSHNSDKVSLFDLDFAGMMTPEELEAQINLGELPIQLRGGMYKCKMLASWPTDNIRNPSSLKGTIAELVACVGKDFASKMVLDL
ncbi:arginine-tRNA-protein transferase 1 [Microthyrium microscopicum]|uniref:Arginyl-tRNA--protein transferase 1 n=1 Tax=Microthyrium microscopicum TaxID=703497 RepID=A0A6A6U8D8_9PEZI|nr:arginine-tRNA-protein transferase 1 [Microthyrium microscopicum]